MFGGMSKLIKYKPLQSEDGFYKVYYNFEGDILERLFWTKDQAERFIKKEIKKGA